MILNNNFIYTEWKIIENAKANVIITHGLGESSQDYFFLANFLNKCGYNVLLYDVRGHGKSSGKRGYISNFHFFLDDLFQLVQFVKKTNNLKIFLLGHSMGGIIVNNYVIKYGDIDGVIVSSAVTTIDSKYFFYQYPYYLLNFKNIKLVFNKSEYKQDYNPYHLDYATPRLIRNILILSINYLNKNLSKYLVPVLFLHCLKDKIVAHHNSQRLFDKISIKDKNIKLYNYFTHNLFHFRDRKIIVKDVVAWLDKKTRINK